jgi:8-oxo-dGTP pyrophosphatase MutT (NUDIX family)
VRAFTVPIPLAVAERVSLTLAQFFADRISQPVSVAFADRVTERVGDPQCQPGAELSVELPPETRRELDRLGARFGTPLVIDAPIPDRFDDPIRKPDRYGEVCMVVRRPNGKLLLAIKTFYPRGAYRLPTGGIHRGEPVFDALIRETNEETGLRTEVRRFLAQIAYHGTEAFQVTPLFHTFAFLLDETGGSLGAIDTSEQIEDWREIAVADLPSVADVLDDLQTAGTLDIGGDWAAWGKFRAVVHRTVFRALTSPGGRTGTR